MTRWLDLEGSLDITGAGDGFTLRGEGAVLRCDVRSVGSGLGLLRLARANAPAVRTLVSWLDRAGLRLSVRYRDRVVFEAGAGIAPTWLTNRFGHSQGKV
jgi:hypothetical protein